MDRVVRELVHAPLGGGGDNTLNRSVYIAKVELEEEGECPSFDKSLWMSLDCEDECGVEVACTMSFFLSMNSCCSSTTESSSSTKESYAKTLSSLNINDVDPPPDIDPFTDPPSKQKSGPMSMKRRLSLLKRG